MKRPEDNVQAGIVKFIRTVAPDVVVFSVPNGGRRSFAEAAMLKSTGLTAGIPDLCIVQPGGKVAFLEVKAGKGTRTQSQVQMIDRFISMAVPYAVVRSVDEVITAFKAWKIPTKIAE